MVLLSFGNPAWRLGAVKRVCVCLYSDTCFKSPPRLRVPQRGLQPCPVTPDPFPQTRLLAALSAICLPTPPGLASQGDFLDLVEGAGMTTPPRGDSPLHGLARGTHTSCRAG